MKRGQKTTIKIIDDSYLDTYKEINAYYLGEGSFSRCYYTDEEKVYSYTSNKREDYSKEAICGYENLYMPRITKEGHYDFWHHGRRMEGILYSMPLYNKLTKEYKDAWKYARILQRAKDETVINMYKSRGYEINYAIIEAVKGLLPDELLDALESINSECMNYNDNYLFEFNNANLAVDNNGNLILLDVIFSRDSLIR